MKPNHLPLPDYDHGRAVNRIEREIKKTRRAIILIILAIAVFVGLALSEYKELKNLRSHPPTQTQETNQ